MFRLLVLFALLMWTAPAAATPRPEDTISFNRLDIALLESLVKTKIDSVRMSAGQHPLFFDATLAAAARDHARYLQVHNEVSHYQRSMQKRSVMDRVRFYGATGLQKVGENVLWKHPARLKQWDAGTRRYREYFFYTYLSMADAIVKAWMESPDHRRTLLIPEFRYTALAIQVDPATSDLMVVQVFAAYTAR